MQGEQVARRLIGRKLTEMGPMSFHEKAVGSLFIFSVILWFFRKPQFIAGWAEMITEHKVSVNFASIILVIRFLGSFEVAPPPVCAFRRLAIRFEKN